jgi:hypothetical protein
MQNFITAAFPKWRAYKSHNFEKDLQIVTTQKNKVIQKTIKN